jgi:ATP-dependent Lhr-like helicase
MPLASGLAEEVVRLRGEVAARLPQGRAATEAEQAPAIDWLRAEYHLSGANAGALVRHCALQAQLSAIPIPQRILVELYRERGISHYFFHILIGRSANDALSRMVAQRVHALKGGNALVTIDDYGFQLSLRPFQELTVEECKQVFGRAGAEAALRDALADASLVKWQFRGVAQTGLMVPRRAGGTERKSHALQWSSEIIFNVLRQREPDHPLLAEAYAEATQRFLDLPRAIV